MKILNNKGQALVLFILILPLILIIGILVIDLGNLYYEKEHLNGINKMVIRTYLDGNIDENEIYDLILKNDNNVEVIIDISDDDVTVKINKEIESIFGNIINFKKYEVLSEYRGYINKKEIRRVG